MPTLSFTELTAKVVTEYPEYIQNVDLIEAKIIVGYPVETQVKNKYTNWNQSLLSTFINYGDIKNIEDKCKGYCSDRLSDFEYKILSFLINNFDSPEQFEELRNIREVYNYILSSVTRLLKTYSYKCEILEDWALRATLKKNVGEICLTGWSKRPIEPTKGLSECKGVIHEYLSALENYLVYYSNNKEYKNVGEVLSDIDPKLHYRVYYKERVWIEEEETLSGAKIIEKFSNLETSKLYSISLGREKILEGNSTEFKVTPNYYLEPLKANAL